MFMYLYKMYILKILHDLFIFSCNVYLFAGWKKCCRLLLPIFVFCFLFFFFALPLFAQALTSAYVHFKF